MMKTSMFKFLLSIVVLAAAVLPVYAEKTFVSIVPGLTEVMYKIGAENSLLGVSTTCTYPKNAQKKEKVGNNFFANSEKIININPDYLISFESSKPMVKEIERTKTKVLYFEFETISDIYKAVTILGQLSGHIKEAGMLNSEMKAEILKIKTQNPKKILYLLQIEPYITIGSKSFITDIINKSGQNSVTKNLLGSYPNISAEYIVRSNPEIIILSFPSDTTVIKKLCPKAKIVVINAYYRDVINRPGPRVGEAVKYFSSLQEN